MRTHQTFEFDVVAANFRDIFELMKITAAVLEGLQHVPKDDGEVRVTIFKDWSRSLKVQLHAEHSDQSYGTTVPDGCSEEMWTATLELHLYSLLMSTWEVERDSETLLLTRR